MTLKDAKNELNKLNNELELYLAKKRINFLKTQPSAVKYKDIVANTNMISDRFMHYVVKDEDLDNKIYELQENINAYEKYVIEEMKRLSKYDEIGLIQYLRDEEKMEWKHIDELLHRGRDYSRSKYRRKKTK